MKNRRLIVALLAGAAFGAGLAGFGRLADTDPADSFLFSGAATTSSSSATSDTLNQSTRGDRPAYVQVEISAAATVKVQGRVSSSYSWVDLYTFTASGMAQVPRPTQLRLSITGNTGTVAAGVSPYGK